MKKMVIVLVVLLIAMLAWGLIQYSDVSVISNGHELAGPMKVAVGAWGVVVTAIFLFCAAILLAFIFAGVGLVILGGFVLVGLILGALAFPFLLPLLIPLLIVWAFVAGTRRGKAMVIETHLNQPPDLPR